MSSTNHGDIINQWGDHNIGKISNEAQADPGLQLLELIRMARILREHVSYDDCQVIDESVEILRQGDGAARVSLRCALGNIAGIAALVGDVGAPVIEAVRKVVAALGIGLSGIASSRSSGIRSPSPPVRLA